MLPFSREGLLKEYSKCGDRQTLAKVHNLPLWFINFELLYNNIIQGTIVLENSQPDMSLSSLRNGLRKYKTIRIFSQKKNISEYKLRKSLRCYGVLPKRWIRAKPHKWQEDNLKEDLESTASISDLLKKYNCSRKTLIDACEKLGIKIPYDKMKRGKKYNFSKEQLVNDYEELRSLTAIKNKYKCSLYTIWNEFNKMEIPHTGRKNNNV